jgi:seryl-tRNA synthetase
MPGFELPLANVDEAYLAQLEYALAFAADGIVSHTIDSDRGVLSVELSSEADVEVVTEKVRQLLERYQKSEFGLRASTYFEQRPEVGVIDAWQELLDRRLATQVGDGHVILRGEAAEVHQMIEQVVLRDFAAPFGAEPEVFPATILSSTLDRLNHFTSFPEHVDFVAHLVSDIDVLRGFADACRDGPWKGELHDGRMAAHDFAISPSCCYHCYEGMQDWELPPPGRCVTAVLGCHRFEGANQRSLSRLRAFTMREVIWIGHPRFVLEARAEADGKIIAMAERWGLHCTYEAANDMFFTDDYAVKASFQRQQEAKKELRVLIPQESTSISVISSNFHSTTFGKAFNITVKGRPAASACVGWGLERIVYAIFSQFGFDPTAWPTGLREDFQAYRSGQGR